MHQVGKQYVVGSFWADGSFIPTQCNCQYNPEHPCRTTIISIGRKNAKVMLSGYNKPTTIPLAGLHEIDAARAGYRQSLEARDARWLADGIKRILGKSRIDQLVSEL